MYLTALDSYVVKAVAETAALVKQAPCASENSHDFWSVDLHLWAQINPLSDEQLQRPQFRSYMWQMFTFHIYYSVIHY